MGTGRQVLFLDGNADRAERSQCANGIEVVSEAGHKEKGDTMTLTDVMTIFRQIIGYIARINKTGAVKIGYVAQDMGVDIVDMRLWLRLMESMNVVTVDIRDDSVTLRLSFLDWIGVNTRNLEAE